jgi:hypothetical protein
LIPQYEVGNRVLANDLFCDDRDLVEIVDTSDVTWVDAVRCQEVSVEHHGLIGVMYNPANLLILIAS